MYRMYECLERQEPEKGHPEHRRSLPSMEPRHTVHPEHTRSCASMYPRYTVHPEHKKAGYKYSAFLIIMKYLIIGLLSRTLRIDLQA